MAAHLSRQSDSFTEASLAQPEAPVRAVVYPIANEHTLRDLVREFKATGPACRQQLHTVSWEPHHMNGPREITISSKTKLSLRVVRDEEQRRFGSVQNWDLLSVRLRLRGHKTEHD
jgi:hypothetical protein